MEAGNRVAFFASSTGEVERLADILNEYGIPYQLGLEQSESTPAYLAERAYMAGSRGQHLPGQGAVRHGAAFPDSKLVVFGSEDLFETLRAGRPRRPPSKAAHGGLLRRPDRSQARRLRGARRARRGAVPGPARDRAGRSQGRLHAARVRRRSQALRAADPHGPGAALPRRGRGASRRSTAWAAPPGPAPSPASKPRCATWRTSC